MKYYTKEWQKQVSDAPDNARTLADAARTGYRWYHEKNRGFDYADLTVICEDIVNDACPTGQECPKKKKKKK